MSIVSVGAMRPDYMREWQRRHYRKLRDIIDEAKRQPCADCGKTYPTYVMDFDHVRGEKSFNIATGLSRMAEATLRAEIEKCDVVCSNCHRERTWGCGNG